MKIEQVIKQNKDEILDIKFDITKLHRKTNKNFSLFDTLKFAPYKEEFLIKQPIKNSCLLTSTYNAFPKLFKYSEKKFLKVLNKFQKDHTIPKLLKMYKNLKETDAKIESLINIEKPVIISVAYAYSNNSHAVAIFGYDTDNYAYFENGFNDAILISTINSLNMQLSLLILQNRADRRFFERIGYEEFYDFRKNWGNKIQDKEYNNWIINYFSNDVFAKFGKLTVIKKDFLDMTIKGKKMITYSGQYNFTEDVLNDPDTFSNFNIFEDPVKMINFSDLTERLNRINFSENIKEISYKEFYDIINGDNFKVSKKYGLPEKYDGDNSLTYLTINRKCICAIRVEEKEVRIMHIESLEKKGLGRKMLQWIIDNYSNNYDITLHADGDEKLVNYYESLGFEFVNDNNEMIYIRQ